MQKQTFTYQARLSGEHPSLDAYARLFCRLERKLYVDRVHRKTDLNQLKSHYIARYGINARMFNAMRISVDGRIQSVLELLKQSIDTHQQKISKKSAQVARLEQKIVEQRKFIDSPAIPIKRKLKARLMIEQYKFRIHHLKRAVVTAKARVNNLQDRLHAKNPKICFGTKTLFRAQFGLDKEDAEYQTLFADWKRQWDFSRNHQIYLVGSKDESCGNVNCQVTQRTDNRFDLKLRLPDALASEFGKFFHATFELKYGAENLLAVLSGFKKEAGKLSGTALTYRLHKDAKGWRVLVSLPENSHATSFKDLGVMGLDLNADHLAVSETDRFGNLVKFKRFDLYLNNKTSDQRQALIGNAAKAICEWAKQSGKPIAIERLDFKEKKQDLNRGIGREARYNRMLSSLAYSQIHSMLSASAFRHQVEILTENPAFTSVIGRVNHAKRLGVSTHIGAALAIARRAQNFSERLMIDQDGHITALGRDNHPVTLKPPVRTRSRHVWSLWSQVNTLIKRPLAEGVQCRTLRASLPQPTMTST